jgi:phage terminase large subunit
MSSPYPKIQFPLILAPLFEPHLYKVVWGGRGGLKTRNIAQALVILGAATSIRVICCREIQKSLKDSVHQELADAIVRAGLDDYYRILDNEIRGINNGTFFIFTGLKSNSSSIKSTAALNIAWVEEAEGVSKSSWEFLEPTMRTPWLLPCQFWPIGTKFTPEERRLNGRWVDPEIWCSFNPDDETD